MTPAIAVGVMVVFVMAFVFINRSARRREAERAEEYRKAAALRGWELEFDGFEYRYRGATEGVRWLCRIGHYRRRSRERRPLRWQTDAVKLEHGACVVWPDLGDQGNDALKVPGVPRFVLNLAMRPVAWALGGDEHDADILANATEVVEGPPGYLFRARHPQRMREWLANGAAQALEAERSWLTDREQHQHLIVAVLWHRGLEIATPYGSHDFNQIERVARVGSRLAKAAQRTAS